METQKFVDFFRMAAPYFEGHRGRTFVIAIPSEVVENEDIFFTILEDVLVLSGLGIKLVIVYGCSTIVTRTLTERGLETKSVGGYRVTNSSAMQVAMEVAGMVQLEIEARLSRGPSVSVVRRHTRGSSKFHYAPPVNVVSGNYTTAKRRGIVNGVDFGHTGQVRFVQRAAISKQLDAGNIVVLSNIGFSAVGEVLNCNIHDVASHAAIELKADKLICLHDREETRQELGEWMALPDAERLLARSAQASILQRGLSNPADGSRAFDPKVSMDTAPGESFSANGTLPPSWYWDLDTWRSIGVAMELVASVAVCKNGVKRAHLVNANIPGALLLELYSRDGCGTMISADFYEGIRPATSRDVDGISSLLQPLVAAGVVLPRSTEDLLNEINDFTVVERESKVLACVCLKDVGVNARGQSCAEVAAFCVDSSYRNGGRGDSLLDYVEQKARAAGFDILVLLTTRTADWFCCRGFSLEGTAATCSVLPDARRARIDAKRGSQCYSKKLMPASEGMAPAGKRIGF